MRSGLALAALLTIGSTMVARAAEPAAPAPKQVYRLASVVPFKGKAPGWDYVTLEAKTGRLFIGRRADGVTVYDTRTGKVVKTIARSQAANGAVLVPEFDRGYTANGDGTTTVFRLSDLATLDRVKLGPSADAAYYDPASKRVIITRGDDHRLTFIDARSGRVEGDLVMQADELEGVAADGHGGVYVSERDKTKVAKVDPAKRALVAEWDIGGGCALPTGVGIDPDGQRLFLGCKGDQPVLAVLDTASGRTVASVPIGRGNDGVVFDPVRKRVLTSNGVEGNIVILDQLGPDSYRLEQAVTTRPIARTMAYDRASGTIYTVAAEGLVDPSRPINTRAGTFYPNAFYDDSFRLFVFKPVPYTPAAPAED
jgi:DNA-binding beta-propeller fold protein YncE